MARADARRRGGRRWASDGRVTIVARLAFALASALALAASRLGVDASCADYTNCGACVANPYCGWCGNDPYSTGGYGNTNHGDHNGVVGPDGYGEGMITVASGVVTGINTRFTKMFHSGGVQQIKSATGTTKTGTVTRVTSDTSMTVSSKSDVTTAEKFTLDMHVTPTGTLTLAATVTALPGSGSTQQVTITGSSTEFTKELKVGYWLILYGTAPATPEVRVITSITSDTSLTVDYDLTGVTWATWGYVSCPPRIGKRGVGMGTIQNHKEDQSTTFQSVAANAASTKIEDASGAATGKTVRIGGQGTRFASQLGASTTWNTYSYTSGPWMSVQINGDWETVQVKDIGTDGTSPALYSEYVAELHNSFSEPLLKATHWEYYTMLTKGYGKVRSYGKRVVSNAWGNKEGFEQTQGVTPTTAGSLSSTGAYGDTRFLTQLRTGYTITACGQTRMVNSIQSDVELTIDRPFTLGNIEYIQDVTSGSTFNRANLHVRGLTRLLPLWPRGVTVQITAVTTGTFNYTTYWKTFANAATTNPNTASTSWLEIQDSGVSSGIGVYIKWASTTPLNANDEFRLHVADIENCQYHISTEGERFMTDDNLNPPICYNHGRCIDAQSDTVSTRPSRLVNGTNLDIVSGVLTGTSSKFLSELAPGDIINDGTDDHRVVSITDDVSATLDDSSLAGGTGLTINVKRCAGGRFDGTNHETTATIIDDDTREAYMHHPKHTYYQTYSHLYCEVDPGCCGFRLSSVVNPERYAYYFVKPDHSDYDFRIAVHTVNDNLDLYTKIGATQPTTAAYDSTSVRESVPWAIDVDASTMACSGNLAKSVLGGATAVATAADAYNSALGKFIHADNSPDCSQVTVGIMGDNRYPQTVGASEYTARVYMEFNFADFECDDSAESGDTYGANSSFLPKCVQHNLRFAGDAKPVLSNTAYYDGKTHTSTSITQEYVIRLTESYARISSSVSNVWKASTDFRTSQRSGAVWWHRKVHIWDGFETNFEFRITNPTQCGGADTICDGADGFAFVISNDDRQEAVTSFHGNEGWACTAADNTNTVSGSVAYTLCAATPANGGGMIGCPGDGLGYGESTMADSASFNAVPSYCDAGLKKSLAVEFDTFYNVERRDPKQGKEHWWINATEYVSYNDNHLGVFMTTDTSYASQPWGSDVTRLTADHSDDDEGAHYGSTPSVPTMADNLKHTVKIRYTRGFTTEKAGSGTIATAVRAVTGTGTLFKTELRTGFEFGYGGRVKANAKIKLNLDKTDIANAATNTIAGLGFGIDSMAVRVLTITSDTAVTLMGDTTDEPAEFLKMHDSAFPTAVDTLTSVPPPSTARPQSYNIIKEFPGEIQVFIDDMDRYVFQVAVEDRDMAKILDHDGNAYIGLTASTGSKGFAKVGYTPASVHQTTDIYSWNYCSSPGCVAY
uniref:Uncharacterized protein n=1 Tax=Ostreococcus mediterraneus TaxID=1486918 RepID=A0A7S0KG39_9CHLO|mmetsp:Transcript_4097/g.14957  ORF Transcript_4097/g.14957 Transcript_4097/m.14957 type:complete len:1417 (+) Transcript_4097:301-4551(+)